MATFGSAVQYDRHILEDMFVVETLQLGECAAVELTGTQDEDRQICDTVSDGGICDTAEGDIVEEDKVKAFGQERCQLIQALS